jgi:diguanylate cyclase (GGDEF)-like protein
MTLYRQLLIFTLLLFLILFAGSWLAKLQSTRSFLMEQLESHAQDTATSLGLSLSPPMTKSDMSTAETMINAVFDRGYYRIVRLNDLKNNTLIDRQLKVVVENVPDWFIKMVPVETPSATAQVMIGWKQVGSIYVESHPGYAYNALWEGTVRTFIWFLITGVGILVLGGLGLRILLIPLRKVERQANALCKRQYETQEKLPRTRELRQVVKAMNRMTVKVKNMFDEQANIAEQLQKTAYSDSVTGLGNRRYLERQVSTRLNRRDSNSKGAFLLVQIHNLQQINLEKGFQVGDEYLYKVGQLLQQTTSGIANTALAHLTGGDFGIFLPDAGYDDANHVAELIISGFSRFAAMDMAISDNVGHLGGVISEKSCSFSTLLAGADTNLRSATQSGPNQWIVNGLDQNTAAQQGKLHWEKTLEKALESQTVVLYGQPVVNSNNLNQVFHLEILSRIPSADNQLLSTGAFLPMAERLNIISSLDRMVFKKAMAIDIGKLASKKIAINMAPSSLLDLTFREWIFTSLQGVDSKGPQFIFEFSEFGAVQHLEMLRDFSTKIRKLGHTVGLDHYGQSFSNFGYLKSLMPDYVKIDRAYTEELVETSGESQFFISSMCSVAHSLDVEVIAEGVENEAQLEILKQLNVDGVQGYLIDKPKEILISG